MWVVHFERERRKFVKKLLHAFLEILQNPRSVNPKKKLKKSKLKINRIYQDRWATKFIWFKPIYGGWQEEDGEVQNLFQN